MKQNHFTLSFPLKSPAAAKALAEQLPPLMPDLFRANDTIGTVHYSRFTVLSEKTLLFLGDFDGEFGQLMADLAGIVGPVFDAILRQVDNPPPTPVTANIDAFVKWTKAHLVHAVNLYTAYPDATAKEIKALASAADISGAGELRPFLVILPIKSYLHFIAVQLILRARGSGTTKDLDKVGTPHFAQFVPLEDNQIGFFTVYDGSFDKYIADFTKISERSSILSSSSRRTRHRRRAESTFRSSSTLRQEQTALRSGSIRPIPVYRFRTSMP
jgi:hypothetical protein